MEIIERNATAQAQLIEDLLDVSRIVAGKLQLAMRPLENVAPLVNGIVESFRPTAQAKQITLRAILDQRAGPIAGDRDRLQQVIWNLVSNAVKFTPAGGRVDVRCERTNGEVEIGVTDTGKGIPAAFLPHIFDRFRQADATSTRAHGGLGLGLSIVRHLVELHGGTVSATSAGEGKGATITVRLPVAGEALEGAPPAMPARGDTAAASADTPLQGLRVLLVEDDEDTREMLGMLLERYGATVQPVATATAALAALKRRKVDCLVCDIGLPGINGYDLIRQVRKLSGPKGGAVPALALTAYASVSDRQQALAAGFQEHVPKPIDPITFIEVIARLGRPLPAD
jgi:CheY-like chemotaxis protein